MATRNRTILFRKYRDALRTVRSPTQNGVRTDKTSSQKAIGLAAASSDAPRSYAPLRTEDPATSSSGAVALGLPPEWVDLSEDVASNVQRAHSKMAELTKAHAKALVPSFGGGKEDQQRIEILAHE